VVAALRTAQVDSDRCKPSTHAFIQRISKGEQDDVAEQCRKGPQIQTWSGKVGGHMLLLEGVKSSDAREGGVQGELSDCEVIQCRTSKVDKFDSTRNSFFGANGLWNHSQEG